MYKIFFKDRLLVLTDNIETDLDGSFASILKYGSRGELQQYVDDFEEDDKLEKAFVYHHNLHELMQDFRSLFKNLPAAGGLVWNEDYSEFLGINRLGYFDLPKGKVEKGESFEAAALREVEEECGIGNLELRDRITRTYHTYRHKGERILKETHWYLMRYYEKSLPRPQTEEGIDSVFWVSPEMLPELLEKTYPSIKEVLHSSPVRFFNRYDNDIL